MSVRFSQLLVAIVLALVAIALFRTTSAYEEAAIAADLRERGARIVERETMRLGQHIADIESLAAETGSEGYAAQRFEAAARRDMERDAALRAVDYFNADDVHVAHAEAGGGARLGPPAQPKGKVRQIARAEVEAIEVALFDAELSRATSVSDVPPKLARTSARPESRGQFFLATRVVWRGREVGSIVEILDVGRLIADDVARVAPAAFALDDGRGRLLESDLSLTTIRNQPDTQTFPITFADRVLQLTLAEPPQAEASPWWFVFGWLALVLAIVLPIEVVGNMNRRVQALNEELEIRVAARTHELEESLEESRRLGVVVESVHEGVMRIGAAGVIGYANAALCRELLLTASELVGRRVDCIEALGISAQQLAGIREGVSESGFVYREMERRRADGTRYIAGVTFTRHGLDSTGSLVAVSRDVTERRRLVDQLLEAKSKLEREMRARADFIATASHELRTPVTTLRTLAALVQGKLGSANALSGDDTRLLEILDHETRRLAHLVDDLLKIAKIDAPESLLAAGDIDLREIVRAELEQVGHLGEPGPRIVLHLGETPAMVRGEAEALRSVIQNLVGNARKFTLPSGRVDVTVEENRGRVHLVVADSGVGIPKSDLPHIFERFYRAPTTAARASGAGLGLAIVARLVDLMNGTISVASEVGRGTTIIIEYPSAAGTSKGPAAQASSESA